MVSAFAAVSLGVYAVLTNISERNNSVKFESISFIRSMATEAVIIQMFEELRKVRHYVESHKIPISYKEMQIEVSIENSVLNFDNVIKKTLNYYEVACIGVKRGALHEEIIKDWCGDAIVADWIDLQQYVYDALKALDYDELYIEVERHVRRWVKPGRAGELLPAKR